MTGLTREQFYGLLDNWTPVESILLSAYMNEEEYIWKNNLGKDPHGQRWFTSFHSSSFPGDDTTVCDRALIYSLLDPINSKHIDPKGRTLMDSGLMIEHMFVKRWSSYGVLLSADVTGDDQYQTGFEDPSCWLTGSPDAILLPPFSTKSHPVEVKTTSVEKVLAMLDNPENTIYSHKKYERQIKSYISEVHDKFFPTVVVCDRSGVIIKNGSKQCSVFHEDECAPKILQVEPPDGGTLLYSARDEPLLTVSYYIPYDPDFVSAGKERLKGLKNKFINDELPAHVRDGESAKWTVGECKYCFCKPFCKEDYKNKIDKISKSNLENYNKKFNSNYSFKDTKQEVLDRWM